MLRLWDYPDSLISSLNGRHRKFLWGWILTGGIPLRGLGLVLRFLLVPYEGTKGGGINNRTSNSEVDDDIVGDRAGILVGASNTLGFLLSTFFRC